jgi:hypothetical protein
VCTLCLGDHQVSTPGLPSAPELAPYRGTHPVPWFTKDTYHPFHRVIPGPLYLCVVCVDVGGTAPPRDAVLPDRHLCCSHIRSGDGGA